ncbi:Terminase-like family protein [Candidatus Fokinia solitaria]|uniref:Terminase-like family protein n=1 Tax=Candidatus Fokinia solitaria TaxID=1802984 RepID=A0A2U8BRH5_9RICK|nr:hypothetical protein [Candidatus Fokinia solitaria]AWD32937.1 Terminase-like family protein [Candidatus Fokinia solitaria]
MKKLSKIFSSILKEDFYSFFHKAFRTLHPTQELYQNWHIRCFIENIKLIEKGIINRLIVNIPPRALKSIIFSVIWPSWILGRAPDSKIITVSYNKSLAIKHNMDCKTVMQSDWYCECFPCAKQFRFSKDRISTAQLGYKFATSPNSTLLGEGADIIIIDDPQIPQNINSLEYREKTYYWFQSVLFSRLNSPKNGIICLIMQRLHEQDLSGKLLQIDTGDFQKWHHVIIEALASSDRIYKFGDYEVKIPKNQPFDTFRYTKDSLSSLRNAVGESVFLSQYQQEPLKHREDSIVREDWIQWYNDNMEKKFDMIYQSWDCASKSKVGNDYSAMTEWGINDSGVYLLQAKRVKAEYLKLKNFIIEEWQKRYDQYSHKMLGVIIEEAASGIQLIQELPHITNRRMRVISYKPKYSKKARLSLVSFLFEVGKIFFPKRSIIKRGDKVEDDHVMALLNEIVSYPYCKNDDLMDSAVQFLHWYSANVCNNPRTLPKIRLL